MWRPPPDDDVDGIRQEVRRARRRWNAYVVQRALYGLVTAAALAVSLVILLALAASLPAFVVALAVLALGLAALAARLAVGAWRAWIGAARAPVWVDRRAGMNGRLATLLELGARGRGFFHALLTETTLARRRAFAADEVVPSPVPLLAFAAAVCALVTLPLAVRLAPLLEPPAVATVDADASGTAPPIDGLGNLFRRVLSSRTVTASPDAQPSGARASAGAGEPRATSGGLAASLQARIRRHLWSERWARAGDAVPGDARVSTDGADPSARRHATARAGERDPARRAAAAPDSRADTAPAGTAAGAGTGTDPNLFGPSTSPEGVDEGRFALGLAARVRTVHTGPRPPAGDAPDAEPDARPTLAARQRPDAPAHRATVPPAFAAIVRDAYAHRPSTGDVGP